MHVVLVSWVRGEGSLWRRDKRECSGGVGVGPGRRGGSEERCTGQAWARDGVARRLAAYGSSGLVEESAQDGDLEERVERHVICARASGHRRQCEPASVLATVASVLAGG